MPFNHCRRRGARGDEERGRNNKFDVVILKHLHILGSFGVLLDFCEENDLIFGGGMTFSCHWGE